MPAKEVAMNLSRWGIVCILAAIAGAILPRAAAAKDSDPCPRPDAGSIVSQPVDLYSRNGVLNVSFDYYTTVSDAGITLFCFVTPDGVQSPTLHVRPGDRLELTVTNRVPRPPPNTGTERVSNSENKCGDSLMTITSMNMHFHGTNTSPTCHSDQVVHTIVNSGQTFTYSLKFPENEPPGLYWYHPHVHGLSSAAVQGGASGAIVVEGIEKLQPAIAGLPQRILLIRDQNIPSNPNPGGKVPSWDISLNYVPILYPEYVPAVLQIQSGATELWRVVNASADTIVELVLEYDGVAQPLRIVALDGVPTGSQDGTRQGKIVTQTSIRLPPAARAEFIVTAPGVQVKNAMLLTQRINTGPFGDSDPERPLATIQPIDAHAALPAVPEANSPPNPQRFEGLASAKVTAKRTVFFSEAKVVIGESKETPARVAAPPPWRDVLFQFYITVDGQTPTPFAPLAPPSITTRQGAVEDWTIQNRSYENHEFHMHQIHFLLMERDGAPVPQNQQQFLDMVEVPFWSGSGPYPSVTLRMDFRGADVGDFVYHCHILDHEDAGMMAIIRVLPRS
jgi:FtsP/CotA-like multicopper oxidase with cupredoxin domain